MSYENVILVDEHDKVIGEMEKIRAHQLGVLHRAFSVFVLNSKGEMLMQQRALSKYHSGGLWTNTCCSHPRPGEDTLAAAKRRLKEEMGMELELKELGSFIYKTSKKTVGFEDGLTEHEYDHVFTAISDQDPVINKEEVEDFKWMSIPDIKESLKTEKEKFTFWFEIAFNKYF